MLINNRVLFIDGADIEDLSIPLSNLFAGSAVVNPSDNTKHVYIGSDLPFNHRYFRIDPDNANDVESIVAVDIYDGFDWEPAVDVLDQTQEAGNGVPFSQNGIISWQTDRNKVWGKQASTELMKDSGLETLKIYNLYWVRLTFSAGLKNTTTLKYVGHKFSNDSDLGGYYPDLNRVNVMASFKAGKADWEEQCILAAEEIVRDLRKKNVIWNANQIFGWDEFADASVHKVAEIVYTAFGKDYSERREDARENYGDALDKVVDVAIDKNEDGRLSTEEKRPNFGRLIRG